ncbi:MAG: hypothetical protein RLZZ50_950 [Verrucomicrobiota bacterium]
MQSLLARQIKRHLPPRLADDPSLAPFLNVLTATYEEFHQNQALAEHTLQIVSDELTEANQRLRAESESRLAELNRYYRQTLELQQGMILCYERRDGRFVHTLCSGRLAGRLGLAPEGVIGRQLGDFLPPDLAEKLGDAYSLAWSGSDCQVEFDALGGELSCLASLRPRFQAGVVNEVIVSGVDVTELKRAQAEAQKLALVAARTDNAVVITNARGLVEWVNHGFTRMTGYELSEIVGRKPGSFLQGPETDPATVAFMRRRSALGESYRTEVLNYAKNGRKYWLAIEVQPIRSPDGTLTHFMAVESDITERRLADESLRAQLGLSRALAASHSFEEARPAIVASLVREVRWRLGLLWVLSSDGAGLVCVEHWAADPGLAPELVAHARAARPARGEFLPGLAWASASVEWSEDMSLAAGCPRAGFARAAGLRAAAAIPIRAGGDVLGVIELVSDRFEAPDEARRQTFAALGAQIGQFYERMRATEALRRRGEELLRANAELARASHHKNAFLASMSHELRTPLNSILGLSESLLERIAGPLTDRQERYLGLVTNSGRHLLALINDILDLAKIEAGEQTLECSAFSIAELCHDALQLVEPVARRHNQRLESELPDDRVRIHADSRRMKQILINLLGNAAKFTSEGGSLGLRVTLAADGVKFAVWDRGIGIAADDLPRLFMPFQQLDSRLSRDYAGTGLGLSLVKQLAQLHDGRVEVESVLGEGSTFTVVLPVSRLAQAEPALLS